MLALAGAKSAEMPARFNCRPVDRSGGLDAHRRAYARVSQGAGGGAGRARGRGGAIFFFFFLAAALHSRAAVYFA